VTTHRPAPLPQHGSRPAVKNPLPDGAVKMQTWFIDVEGRRQRMPYEVPVDAEDHRTPHLRFQCPKMRNVNGGGRERCDEYAWLLPEQKQFCPRHGEQLTPPPAKEARLAAVLSDAKRMYGRAALPWLLPTAGIVADATMSLGGVSAQEAILTAPALAGGAYVVTKRTLTKRAIRRGRIEKGQREGKRIRAITRQAARHAAVAGETGLWATALAGTDLTTWAGMIVAAAAMVRWAVGVKPWWDAAEARRLRDTTPTITVDVPAEQPVEAPDPVRLRAITTWIALIGCSSGPLAGTELVDYTPLPACDVKASIRTQLPNWSAKVVATVAGSINMRENRPTLLGRIAAAYGSPRRSCGPAPTPLKTGHAGGPASDGSTTARTFGTSGGRRPAPPTT
jgi:hypothetical protein